MQKHLADASDIVIEARRWVGTPFRHRGHHIGRACDCVGLIRGVAEALALGAVPPEMEREFQTYARTPNPRRMGELLDHFLVRTTIKPTTEVSDGHIAWMHWRKDMPMHLAITATHHRRPTIIHSAQMIGKVVEHGFTTEWRERVDSYWQFPNVRY